MSLKHSWNQMPVDTDNILIPNHAYNLIIKVNRILKTIVKHSPSNEKEWPYIYLVENPTSNMV